MNSYEDMDLSLLNDYTDSIELELAKWRKEKGKSEAARLDKKLLMREQQNEITRKQQMARSRAYRAFA